MSDLCCKKCGDSESVKNGIVHGRQRYRCRGCRSNFTSAPPRGKPPAMKALAILMYAMGNMSFSAIGRLLGVSDVSVMRWRRAEAEALPEPEITAEQTIVALDEMWHFLKKRLASSGFGEPLTLSLGEPLPGFLVAVMTRPAAAASTKLG